MAGGPGFQALTIKFTGRAGLIISNLDVSVAYDQGAPPDPLPPRASTKALWDTGASKSVVSQELAKALNLIPVGAANVHHAGGSSISPTYLVHFYLPNGVEIGGVIVTEFPAKPNFGAIIGMDVIALGDMSITNVGGRTMMSFRTPPTASIDYVSEHDRQLFAGTKRNAPCPCGSGEKFKYCHGK